jgi:xanthine/CO dehydrogenase XdhC/CoxF family maturation factor
VTWQPVNDVPLGTGLVDETTPTPPHRGGQENAIGAQPVEHSKRVPVRSMTDQTSAPGVFFDVVPAPPRLVIFGAGDDARPVCRFARALGWHVTVADARPAFATAERFPDADFLVIISPDQDLDSQGLKISSDALVVLMTHRYAHDLPLLRQLFKKPLAYLGMLGPRKRAEQILNELVSSGLSLSTDQRDALHAPVGLDLGAETPDEIALSILAEMQSVIAGRDGGPLRLRKQPIH